MLNTLADNARKFTEKGGQVKVSATEGEQYVEIVVEDTGNGMTEEQLEAAGIPAGMVRMSCGLEDKEDLIADLRQALEAI